MIKPLLASLSVALLLTGAPAVARASSQADASTIAAARTYLQAYESLDVEALAAMYAPDAAFIDETSLDQSAPFIWEGREAILAGISDWKTSVVRLDYDLTEVFEAGGRVVFIGGVSARLAGAEGEATFHYPIVTIVTMTGGHVTEHRDYTDYAGARRVEP